MILSNNDDKARFLRKETHMFEHKIIDFIKENRMLETGDNVVVGLSGGADSVSLLVVLNNLRNQLDLGEIIAVHVNHMIRGEEADEDEAYAEALCDKLSVIFKAFHEDIPALAKKLGMTVEEAGRYYRYKCFEELSSEYDNAKIAVAHNANDLAETVIFNLVRGSGIKGVSGIPAVRKTGNTEIIRPLLNTTRSEIEKYLEERNISYRNDSTNASTDYDRNRIRHIIIPELEKINSSAVAHICDVSNEAAEYYDYLSRNKESKIIKTQADKVCLDIHMLMENDELVVNQLIYDSIVKVAGRMKDITRRNVKAVRNIITADSGSRVDLPYNISVRKNYNELIFEKKNEENIKKEYRIEIDYKQLMEDKKKAIYKLDNMIVEVTALDCDSSFEMPKNNYTKVVDYDKIKGALCIRNATDGDYITINEMGNTKKLSRIFIDNKIDRNERTTWPVVADDNQVIWTVGLRYNEKYKIDTDTKKILVLRYEKKE